MDSARPATRQELPYLDVRVLKREGLIDHGQEQLEGIAPLAWTSCNFGGSRPWFVCPGCDRRAAILYEEEEMSGAVLCRHCLELGYQSQREGPIARAKRRAEKARARLAPDGSRPKGMHLATYSKLKREYLEDVQEHDALYQERLARLTVSRIKRRRRRRRRWRPRG